MYLDYFELSKFPFRTNPDPAFLWLSEKHKEALSLLKYGIMKKDGFLLLIGGVGTGKTTLIRYLLKSTLGLEGRVSFCGYRGLLIPLLFMRFPACRAVNGPN